MKLEAGVPSDVIQLALGDGAIGAALTSNPMIGGACCTGSTEVAKLIDRQFAETAAPDAILIAETGGLNAMTLDSTTLPEQAIGDILAADFQTAGQRYSALRILYLQRDIEERFLDILYRATKSMKIGDPWAFSTDAAPVIDAKARDSIEAYCEKKAGEGRILRAFAVPTNGLLVAPHVLRVSGIGAVVGSQPFGGEGLSGTGPKTGGPQLSLSLQQSCYGTISIQWRRIGSCQRVGHPISIRSN